MTALIKSTGHKGYSASSVTTFEACEQKYNYEYVQLYRKKEKSLGLKTGITMHDAQEMYMRGHGLEAVIDSIEQDVKSKGWDQEDPLFLPKIRAYTKGYYNRWEKEDAYLFAERGFKVLGVEEEFSYLVDDVSLQQEIKYVGKIDAILDDGDYIYLMEHKNVSSKDAQAPTSVFWQSLQMNNQLTIYADYLRRHALGDDRIGVKILYDVVITSPATKPKIVDRKTKRRETIKEFEDRLTDMYRYESDRLVRKECAVVEQNVDRRMDEINAIAWKMKEHDQPIRNTTACNNYGGCEFFQCCIGTERVDESSKFEKVDRPHVELTATFADWKKRQKETE